MEVSDILNSTILIVIGIALCLIGVNYRLKKTTRVICALFGFAAGYLITESILRIVNGDEIERIKLSLASGSGGFALCFIAPQLASMMMGTYFGLFIASVGDILFVFYDITISAMIHVGFGTAIALLGIYSAVHVNYLKSKRKVISKYNYFLNYLSSVTGSLFILTGMAPYTQMKVITPTYVIFLRKRDPNSNESATMFVVFVVILAAVSFVVQVIITRLLAIRFHNLNKLARQQQQQNPTVEAEVVGSVASTIISDGSNSVPLSSRSVNGHINNQRKFIDIASIEDILVDDDDAVENIAEFDEKTDAKTEDIEIARLAIPGPKQKTYKADKVIIHNPWNGLFRIIYVLIVVTGILYLYWLITASSQYVIVFAFFAFVEFINYILGLLFLFNMWKIIDRHWKSFDELSVPFPKENYPKCDIIICHYQEDLDVIRQTLTNCLEVMTRGSYPQNKLHVWILDDGFFLKKDNKEVGPDMLRTVKHTVSSVMKHEIVMKHFFTDTVVRSDCSEGIDRFDFIFRFNEDDIENESEESRRECDEKEISSNSSNIDNASESNFELQQLKRVDTKELLQIESKHSEKPFVDLSAIENSNEIKVLANRQTMDSTRLQINAVKPERARSKFPDAIVTVIARHRPRPHHYKGGNINNFLYNVGPDSTGFGEFILFLDADMKPKPHIFLRTLPYFYEYDTRIEKYEANKVSYVQTPQFFDNIQHDDPLGARNSIFFQTIERGRDGYNSCSFAGTNAIFRRDALLSVGGLAYYSVTEDALTGIKLHQNGWDSIYLNEELCVGQAPDTVASAMQQIKRWVKGAVEISLRNIHICGLCPSNHDFVEISKDTAHQNSSFARWVFHLDLILYPWSSVSPLIYTFVATFMLWSNYSPLDIVGYSFAYTFIPYQTLRVLATVVANRKVSLSDVYRSQQVWFSYAFASFVGLLEAFVYKFTGEEKNWGNTGARPISNWLDWFNISSFLIIMAGIIRNVIMFFMEGGCTPTPLLASIFAVYIAMQLWPLISIGMATRNLGSVSNLDKYLEKYKRLPRYKLPAYFLASAMLLVGLIVMSTWNNIIRTCG